MAFYILAEVILLFILALVYIIGMKPSYRKLFAYDGNHVHVNMSYAYLFSLHDLSKAIYDQLGKKSCKSIYMCAYGVNKYFNKKENLEDIEKTLLKFQEEVAENAYFEVLYYRAYKDIIAELWLENSKDKGYRRKFFGMLYFFYKNNIIDPKTKMKVIRMFCGFT